jgi:aconitate hydratase
MLALTFANEADYVKIQEDDQLSLVDIVDFAPGRALTLKLTHADGSSDDFKVNHSYNAQQIEWFRSGSALNLIKEQNRV